MEKEETLDHILPKSRGGELTWNNTVLACKLCNSKKDNKTPEEAHMNLLSKPSQPTALTAVLGRGPKMAGPAGTVACSNVFISTKGKLIAQGPGVPGGSAVFGRVPQPC